MKRQEKPGSDEFYDPYDVMSDQELDDYVHSLFIQQRAKSVPVSLRMPQDLLARVKRVAETSHVPYQSLIKGMIEHQTADLERRLGR